MAVLTGSRVNRMKRAMDFLVDLVWARPNGPISSSPTEPIWPESLKTRADTLESAYQLLKEEHAGEIDRVRTVETKLLGISGLSPVAMAVIVAGFTALTNRSIQAFTRISVLLVGILAGYVSLQFLRAILAAITGLKRRSFYAVSLKDLYPRPDEEKQSYLTRNCSELAEVIRENRAEIDFKVTWLDVAHIAIRNAVIGLLLLLLTIIVLAVVQTSP